MRVVAICVLLSGVMGAVGVRLGARKVVEIVVAEQVRRNEALYEKGPKRPIFIFSTAFHFCVEERPVLTCYRAKNKEDLIRVLKESMDHFNPSFLRDHPRIDYIAAAQLYPSTGSVCYSRRWHTYEDLPAHTIQVPCGTQGDVVYSGCYLVYYDDDFRRKTLFASMWSSVVSPEEAPRKPSHDVRLAGKS